MYILQQSHTHRLFILHQIRKIDIGANVTNCNALKDHMQPASMVRKPSSMASSQQQNGAGAGDRNNQKVLFSIVISMLFFFSNFTYEFTVAS